MTCMCSIDIIIFYVAGSYEIVTDNTQNNCNAATLNEIKSEDECETAARNLGLSFEEMVERNDDFPACFYDDPVDKVFFNIYKNPKRENASEEYSAICKGK